MAADTCRLCGSDSAQGPGYPYCTSCEHRAMEYTKKAKAIMNQCRDWAITHAETLLALDHLTDDFIKERVASKEARRR